ncbi:hypothetical protein SNEBB_003535 [Seison nebaliae]|nr:hypothetical protein SNEBB_003535 [Seison nebaliae]
MCVLDNIPLSKLSTSLITNNEERMSIMQLLQVMVNIADIKIPNEELFREIIFDGQKVPSNISSVMEPKISHSTLWRNCPSMESYKLFSQQLKYMYMTTSYEFDESKKVSEKISDSCQIQKDVEIYFKERNNLNDSSYLIEIPFQSKSDMCLANLSYGVMNRVLKYSINMSKDNIRQFIQRKDVKQLKRIIEEFRRTLLRNRLIVEMSDRLQFFVNEKLKYEKNLSAKIYLRWLQSIIQSNHSFSRKYFIRLKAKKEESEEFLSIFNEFISESFKFHSNDELMNHLHSNSLLQKSVHYIDLEQVEYCCAKNHITSTKYHMYDYMSLVNLWRAYPNLILVWLAPNLWTPFAFDYRSFFLNINFNTIFKNEQVILILKTMETVRSIHHQLWNGILSKRKLQLSSKKRKCERSIEGNNKRRKFLNNSHNHRNFMRVEKNRVRIISDDSLLNNQSGMSNDSGFDESSSIEKDSNIITSEKLEKLNERRKFFGIEYWYLSLVGSVNNSGISYLSLNGRNIPHFTSNELRSFLKYTPQLRSINLNFCCYIFNNNEKSFNKIGLSHLHEISIENIPEMTSHHIDEILWTFPKITSISFGLTDQMSHVSLRKIFSKKLDSIESFKKKNISELPHIYHLSVDNYTTKSPFGWMLLRFVVAKLSVYLITLRIAVVRWPVACISAILPGGCQHRKGAFFNIITLELMIGENRNVCADEATRDMNDLKFLFLFNLPNLVKFNISMQDKGLNSFLGVRRSMNELIWPDYRDTLRMIKDSSNELNRDNRNVIYNLTKITKQYLNYIGMSGDNFLPTRTVNNVFYTAYVARYFGSIVNILPKDIFINTSNETIGRWFDDVLYGIDLYNAMRKCIIHWARVWSRNPENKGKNVLKLIREVVLFEEPEKLSDHINFLPQSILHMVSKWAFNNEGLQSLKRRTQNDDYLLASVTCDIDAYMNNRFHDMMYQMFPEVPVPFERLTSISLTNSVKIGDNFVIKLSKFCFNLTELDISGCENVSDVSISFVGTVSRKLVFLDVSYMTKFKGTYLAPLDETGRICGYRRNYLKYCGLKNNVICSCEHYSFPKLVYLINRYNFHNHQLLSEIVLKDNIKIIN